MPDFFEPNPPFPAEKFPPKTPEDKAELQAFFAGTANPRVALNKLIAFGHNLKTDGRKKIGVYGFCWGILIKPLCVHSQLIWCLQVVRLLYRRGRSIHPSHH